MKEEVKRILKLVQEGKLSAEDAAELIDAFDQAPRESEEEVREPEAVAAGGRQTPPPPPPGSHVNPDPVGSFINVIEKIGKDVASNVNWKEVSEQLKVGAHKATESLKQFAEQAKIGVISFSNAERREIHLPLSVPAGKTLRIENPVGDIKVYGNAIEGSVAASAKIRGRDKDDAKAKADAYTLVIEESDHAVVIKQPDVPGLSVDLHIHVPSGVPLEVRSTSGDIEVADTQAACRVIGRSGDVRLSGLSGSVDIDMTSGDVWISDCPDANVNLEGKSGDVEMVRVRGSISTRTASGDINLSACSGKTISLEAVAGDIQVDLDRPVDGTVNVRTMHGDSLLSIPDANNCRVALSTLRGEVNCELDLMDEAKLDQRITGRLGEGQGTLDVSAVSGDVSLIMRDSIG